MTQGDRQLTVAVVVCSYMRPEALQTCLDALGAQTRPADDVIVVVRQTDTATLAAIQDRGVDPCPVRVTLVGEPGLVAARNVGLASVGSDVVVFCDDDTRAHPDWLARIVRHFEADPALIGLGGRDRCHDGTRFNGRRRRTVGRLQWFGRAIGNHHLGFGSPRPVDILKGANMAYRAAALAGLRFDGRLRGRGAQPHDDMGFSLALRRRGLKLVYDPAVLLDHYEFRGDQPRAYVARAGLPSPESFYDACYNYVLVVWEGLPPWRRAVFAAWWLLVGMRVSPGLLQVPRLLLTDWRFAWRKFRLAQRAARAAYGTVRVAPASPELPPRGHAPETKARLALERSGPA